MTDYSEGCCWNDIRDLCRVATCMCPCHRDRPDPPPSCDHTAEINRLRATIQLWEEFDFARDNPKRLTEHILALMVERDEWRRKAEELERRQSARGAGG